ncbi:MAG TPA: GAF domain-containing protein, partial [Vicinamibacteria bacterium]
MSLVDDLTVERDEAGLLHSTLEHAVRALGLTSGVTLVTNGAGDLVPGADFRLPHGDMTEILKIARSSLSEGRPLVWDAAEQGWLAAAPLATSERSLGVLVLLGRRENTKVPERELLEALGKQMGTGLENVRLYAQLRESSQRAEFLNR